MSDLGYENEIDLKVAFNDWFIQFLNNPSQEVFQDNIKEIDIFID